MKENVNDLALNLGDPMLNMTDQPQCIEKSGNILKVFISF